ncbi:MAG: sigma-70 family RNA polymerase sigma factor [Bacteroidota bacterium]
MTETELWNSFRQGDRQAFDQIYYQYVQDLLSYGDNITFRKDLVEDCVQETFVELWKKRKQLGATDSIKYYLFKCLRRKIYRCLAQENKHHALNQSDVSGVLISPSPEKILITTQMEATRQSRVQQSVHQLPPRQREAIYLKYYKNLSFLEVAVVMDISVKATYKLMSKAIKTLRKRLDFHPSSVTIPFLAIILQSWLL